MTYVLNLLLVAIYYDIIHFSSIKKTKKENVFAIVVSLHAILFRALAYPYNYKDTENYANAYIYISRFSFREAAFDINEYTGWGQGYVVLNWLLSRLTLDPAIIFIVTAVLCVGLVMWFYCHLSNVILLTVMLYAFYPMLYLMGFAVIRQHLSIAFMLIALYYSHNLSKSIPLAVISVFLHYAGIIFLPYYLWRRFELKNRNFLILICLFGICILGLRIYFGSLLSILSDSGVSRYDSFGQESDNSNVIPVIIIGAIFLLFIKGNIFFKCEGKDLEITKFMTYGLMISIFCIGLSGGGRLTLPFIYVVPVAITLPFKYARNYRISNIVVTIFIFTLFLRQLILMQSNWVVTYDYRFFWE